MLKYANEWASFESKIDLNAINEKLKTMSKGEFEELPDGKYEVSLDSLELKPSKKGFPMVAMELTVVQGDFERRKIFINQVLCMGTDFDEVLINTCNDLLSGLTDEISIPRTFPGVREYAELVDQIADQCVGYEYLISKKSITKKDGKTYPKYKFLEAF